MKTKEKSKESVADHGKESLRTWLRLLSCETVIERQLRTLLRQNFSVILPQFDVLSELERAGDPLTEIGKLQQLLLKTRQSVGTG